MLRVTLAINDDTLADYEVRRVSGGTALHPDTVHTYTVRHIPFMDLIDTIQHRYGDGAHALARKALALEEDR